MQLFLPLCPCLLLWKLLAVYSGTKKGRDLQLSYTNIVTVAISIYCFVKIDWTSAWSFTELIEAMLPQYRQEYRKVWVRECVCAQWILLALLYMIYRRTLVKLLKHNLLFVFKHCIRDVSSTSIEVSRVYSESLLTSSKVGTETHTWDQHYPWIPSI